MKSAKEEVINPMKHDIINTAPQAPLNLANVSFKVSSAAVLVSIVSVSRKIFSSCTACVISNALILSSIVVTRQEC